MDAEFRVRKQVYSREWQQQNRYTLRYRLVKVASRARRDGVEFAISTADFPAGIPECCACCSDRMVPGTSSGPSLDRVDNEQGYVAGNVQWICEMCNGRKREMTVAQLRQLLAYVEAHAP